MYARIYLGNIYVALPNKGLQLTARETEHNWNKKQNNAGTH